MMRFSKRSLLLTLPLLFLASLAWARSVHGSFDKTLQVNGPVDLDVRTGSGDITVRVGNNTTVEIHGKVSADTWGMGDAEERVRAVEANPPIEQTGNIIRIGHVDDNRFRHVSISYELVVPAQTQLTSQTGSGNQTIEGLRGWVSAESGSGDLRLRNIASDVKARTGSGNIEAEAIAGGLRASTGSGDVHASRVGSEKGGESSVETGSGNVRLADLNGSLRAIAGSGEIQAQGKPNGSWELRTGSGNIEVRLPSDAAFDFRGRTGSGDISMDHPLTIQGRMGKHEIEGKVRGGGFRLDVQTGSGDISIQDRGGRASF